MIINHILHRKGLYSANELHQMIVEDGYIPVANHNELYQIRTTANLTFGLGTIWEGTYLGGRDKKYVQVEHIKLTSYLNSWIGIGGTTAFSGIYDGNRLRIDNLNIPSLGVNRSISIFGNVSGTVQNVVSANNIIKNNDRSGGFAIICNGLSAGGYVLNCFVYNSVLTISDSASSSFVASVVAGTVDNCWSFNNVSSSSLSSSGDFCAKVSATGIVKNSGTINGTFNGGYRIGLFVGANEGTIENCIATGNISANNQDTLMYTGGFCGQQIETSTASIKNCASLVNIIMNVKGSYVGGFIGINAIGLIENCYCRASISRGGGGTNNGTGGFAGSNGTGCNITNCYCSTSIYTTGTKQGFVAVNNGTITNSYWNTDYYPTSTNAIGRTTTQLMDLTPSAQIFTNWDTTLWEFGIPNDYPILKLIKEKYQIKITDTYIGIYSVSEIDYMIGILGYIPVVSATEMDNIRYGTDFTFGVGTAWEGTYTSGLDKKYIQLADIEFNYDKTLPYPNGWEPIGNLVSPFTGIYDGNYFTINNFYINRPTNGGTLGIFFDLRGTFKNSILTNAEVRCDSGSGIIAGWVRGGGIVSNVTISNSFIRSGNQSCTDIGGFCGKLETSGLIKNSKIIDSTISLLNYTGNNRVGGIAGYCGWTSTGLIENCEVINCNIVGHNSGGIAASTRYNTTKIINSRVFGGSVTSFDTNTSSGAIRTNGVLSSSSVILNCYAATLVEGTGGGLVGINNGTITNSYYDTDISGQTDTGKGLPRNTLQMNAGTSSSFILPDGTVDPDSLVDNAMYTNWLDSIWDFGTTNESPKII